MFVDPIRVYGAYFYDVITDTLQAITLFLNCHLKYGLASIALIVISYITTVIHLICSLNINPLDAVCYPYYHT